MRNPRYFTRGKTSTKPETFLFRGACGKPKDVSSEKLTVYRQKKRSREDRKKETICLRELAFENLPKNIRPLSLTTKHCGEIKEMVGGGGGVGLGGVGFGLGGGGGGGGEGMGVGERAVIHRVTL